MRLGHLITLVLCCSLVLAADDSSGQFTYGGEADLNTQALPASKFTVPAGRNFQFNFNWKLLFSHVPCAQFQDGGIGDVTVTLQGTPLSCTSHFIAPLCITSNPYDTAPSISFLMHITMPISVSTPLGDSTCNVNETWTFAHSLSPGSYQVVVDTSQTAPGGGGVVAQEAIAIYNDCPTCANGVLAMGATCYCDCSLGWAGPICDVVVCPAECSGHGICSSDGCHCNDDYFGPACSEPYCPDDCSGHGTCKGSDGCSCDEGWGGCNCGHSENFSKFSPYEESIAIIFACLLIVLGFILFLIAIQCISLTGLDTFVQENLLDLLDGRVTMSEFVGAFPAPPFAAGGTSSESSNSLSEMENNVRNVRGSTGAQSDIYTGRPSGTGSMAAPLLSEDERRQTLVF